MTESKPYGYYIVQGLHPDEWYKVCTDLDHLQLEYTLFGFSNKEAHVFISDELAEHLRTEHGIKLDGPYRRVD